MGFFLGNIENNTTIFAFSSGSVPSGIGIIRISGPKAVECVSILTGIPVKKPRLFELRNFIHPKRKTQIDKGLVVWFKKPHSFTGEDIVEFHTHGSIAVVDIFYEVLSNIDQVRLAEPGEFTKRAFYNKKLNLEQVEGLVDVINAETTIQLDHANKLLTGALGQLTENIRESLISVLSKIEAIIEFEDEDIDLTSIENLNIEADNINKILNDLLVSYQNSEIIRDGFRISIVGDVNVGKSSIINRLTTSNSSIVTNVPGTTRDIVEVKVKLFGYPVLLRDTAGVRDTNDIVESLGINKTIDTIKDSDLIIRVFDITNKGIPNNQFENLLNHKLVINVYNKSDLVKNLDDQNLLYLSSLTNFGFDKLLNKIRYYLDNKFIETHKNLPLLARKRHYEIFYEISELLLRFKLQNELELKAEDLKIGIGLLGKITGRVDVEDMLDKLFMEFCIGK